MIINSLLDTDLYKLTMMQFVYFYCKDKPQDIVYTFKCRSNEDLVPYMNEFKKEFNHYLGLKFNDEDLSFLASLEDKNKQIFREEFINYLKSFDFSSVFFELEKEDNIMKLKIKGLWLKVILTEVPFLSIIQEVFMRNNYDKNDLFDHGLTLIKNKKEYILKNNIQLSDFGTRRRFSHEWHDTILQELSSLPTNLFLGTSNVYFARKYKIKAIGTMAHEYFQGFQGMFPLETAQKNALVSWVDLYGDQLNVALTDILGLDIFIKDMNKNLWKKYSGFRHDSGDPIIFGEKIIKELENQNINPKEKTLVFSDGLAFDNNLKLINEKFKNKINVVFGIGTNLTNDFGKALGHKALSIVIKMTWFNGKPTIKMSDSPSKIMCEDTLFIENTQKYINEYLSIKKEVGLISGDGIGPEISNAVERIFESINVPVIFNKIIIGEKSLEKNKVLVPNESIDKIKKLKCILKAPLNTPVGNGFSSVNVFLRKKFNLDLNYRPVQTIKGVDSRYSNVDIVTIRENTQGLYVGEDQYRDENKARSVSVMDKEKLIKFFHRSFSYLVNCNRSDVVIVHKANILKSTSGLFLDTAYEIAKEYPKLNVSDMIVDATAMNLVKSPENFDSIITSNLFGDILSDLCAGLIGGLGVASGANIGEDISIFEAVHGTAPDIAGKDLANPTALILSACLMLDHLNLNKYSKRIRDALFYCLERKETRTKDLGGELGTIEFTNKIISKLKK